MSHSDETDVTSTSGEAGVVRPADQVNRSRRRLMIGALAGPAAVSLPLNASAAAFGSISTCVENSYSNPGVRLHVDPSAVDQYARKLVPGILVEKGKNAGYRSTVLVEYNTGRVYDEEYHEWFRDGSNNFLSPAGETMKDNGTRVDRYTLVFGGVDDFGQFTALDPEAANLGYMPVTTSCYLSIAPLHL